MNDDVHIHTFIILLFPTADREKSIQLKHRYQNRRQVQPATVHYPNYTGLLFQINALLCPQKGNSVLCCALNSWERQPQHPSWMWQCWIIMQDVSLDCYLTCLTVTDLCSRVSFGLRWLSFVRSGGARLRCEVRAGGLRLSSGLWLSRRLWWSLLLSSGGSVGAGWYVCSSIGSGREVSVGAWGDVSIRTWRYDSIGAGRDVRAWRVVEQRAHGRACDWGGRRACHWAADHSHGLHGHLLGLRKEKTTH